MDTQSLHGLRLHLDALGAHEELQAAEQEIAAEAHDRVGQQVVAPRRELEARQADLLPVEYYHVVFTLPAPISALAYSNKALVYRLLFEVAAETLQAVFCDNGTCRTRATRTARASADPARDLANR